MSPLTLWKDKILDYLNGIPTWQRWVLGFMFFTPLYFIGALWGWSRLAGWGDNGVDFIDYRFRQYWIAWGFCLLFGPIYFAPVCLLVSKLKGMKVLGGAAFVGLYLLSNLIYFDSRINENLAVIRRPPVPVELHDSPDHRLKAVLYYSYRPPHLWSSDYGDEYTLAVEGKNFQRAVVYQGGHRCPRPESISWRDQQTIMVNDNEVKLGQPPLVYYDAGGGSPDTPRCVQEH